MLRLLSQRLLTVSMIGGLAITVVVLSASSTARAQAPASGIRLLPAEFTLGDARLGQRLLVESVQEGRLIGQVRDNVTITSSDPNVVKVEEGMAFAVANGKATLTARAGEQTAVAQVTVAGIEGAGEWSFRNHVQSILSKTGCNMGACHGAAAGKNGFKLSLRGYDPEFDYRVLTRQSRGRRIVPDDPGRSLLLTKPTGAIPHKGGIRFREDSLEYRVVSEWIAGGHAAPTDDDPRLARLEVLPENVIVQPGASQQVVVRAHFSNGRTEDVTQWAKFTSTNQTVAEVDDKGLVKIIGHGESAIVAWYLSTNVVATVASPYPNPAPAEVFAEAERSNLIDGLVLDKLRALNLPPSPRCTDGEYLRRAYLDTLGILPTSDETRAFLADRSPDKRERLADFLLTRPEYVDYWTYRWSDMLLLSGARLRPKALESFSNWIRTQVQDNTPWDRFAREVVTASGGTYENGAANFYSLHQDPLDMAETVTMAFLGTSINCARCHDHPLEKWTNDQYYGMANLFSRVRGKGWGGDFRSGDGQRTIYVVDDGELIQPRTGRPQPPRPLDAPAVPFESTADRRQAVAEWLTSPNNAAFRRAVINRVWANYFAVGIVEAVDDMRLTNPASNEPLLAALSDDLLKNHYDLKSLMRLILTSQTYQRSSVVVGGGRNQESGIRNQGKAESRKTAASDPSSSSTLNLQPSTSNPRHTASNAADERYYSRYFPKRLKAEVLLDALSQVSGSPTVFKDKPAGTRALQLSDVNVEHYFLRTFGRPERILTCECERSNEPSMVQVLHLMNGDTVNAKLEAKGNRIDQALAAGTPDAEIVDDAYLSALMRFPTEAEKSGVLQVLAATPAAERRTALEDFYWSLLTSREFLFNH